MGTVMTLGTGLTRGVLVTVLHPLGVRSTTRQVESKTLFLGVQVIKY